MEKVKTQAKFAGTLPEFFAFLRSDPRFFCADEKQLLLEYSATAKRIDRGYPHAHVLYVARRA